MTMALGFAEPIDVVALQLDRLRWRLEDGLERAHLALEGVAFRAGLDEQVLLAPGSRLRLAAAAVTAVALLPPAAATGYFAVAPYLVPTVTHRYVSADANAQAIDKDITG